MNSFQAAASFPFANADLTKAWAAFRVPSLDIERLLEAHRKNAAALTNASQVAFDGLKTLAQRQGDLLKTTVDDYGKVTSDVLAAASFEERAAQQAHAARHIYLSAIDCFRELSGIVVKANLTAADILNARTAEAFDELRALFPAPAASTTATSVAPIQIVVEPVAVVDDVETVGDAVTPVEPEPTVATTAATPVVAEPVAVVEEVDTVEDAVVPVAPKPTVTTTRTTAPKTAAPTAKARRHRRPGDRA